MTNDDPNVIEFAPRRSSVPDLSHVEVRLNDNYGLQVQLFTEDGALVCVLEYTLTGRSPPGYDLAAFKAGWEAWRGRSTRAS